MIDPRDLCKALGVDYDPAKSDDFYLMLVKQYRLHYEAAQQNAHLTPLTVRQNVVCPECETLFAVEVSKNAVQVA